jgi:Bacterial Ig domain/Bacterial Ig-like domain (group 2)
MSGSVEVAGRRAVPRLAAALAIFAALTVGVGCGGGNGNPIPAQPSLTIVSPADGSTVNPGQTVKVSVRAAGAAAFTRGVAVIGANGLGATPIVTAPPFDFSLTVPAHLAAGTYRLTAVGFGAAAKPMASTSIGLDVESPSALLTLIPPSSAISFSAIGEQLPMRIAGSDSAGKLLDLIHSSRLLYRSTDRTVAVVDNNGMVTAVAPGQASIDLALDGGHAGSVPIRVIAPALIPSAASLDFGAQTVGTKSAVQSFTIVNNTGYPLRILAVNSPVNFPETDDCASKSPLAPGGSCAINVRFAPTKRAAARGIVSIADSAVIARTQIFVTGTGK